MDLHRSQNLSILFVCFSLWFSPHILLLYFSDFFFLSVFLNPFYISSWSGRQVMPINIINQFLECQLHMSFFKGSIVLA